MAERVRCKNGVFLPTHGMRHTRIYRVWCAMKGRCNNPNNRAYGRYGGRGIRVCKEWQDSFANFYEWSVENGYTEKLTIDRIDNNKGYSPGNCRWATYSQQNRNYGRNHMITYNEKTQCISDWANEFGIGVSTIIQRIKRGWPIEKLFDARDGRSLRWQTK